MRFKNGFTLIELLVTLALVGIIAGFAIPSFAQLIANNRMSSTSNVFIGALNYARTEAVKRGRTVEITAISSAGSANEWGGGWRVWVDQGSNGYDAGEEIRVYSDVSDKMTIDGPDALTTFGFRANGFVDPLPGGGAEYSFQLCDDRTGETGRIIRIHTSGRVRSDTITCG
ncbi:prepilin-type N-terminal cleavage/methylation domain-containing protein [Marinobacter halodurans]|uniref:Type II secretion system protein H n=1 Tax=Marinobacter halodurans TaxID=2528979 RepID=A0ABY1ZGG4_9GAMM|nr:GspH/FimT family pseudopilin [Marinobacter halodurans]TBW50995.1 prepilin-type N-terminal cleavage/methylation domain-containing protein [Marinobacter halodurans]